MGMSYNKMKRKPLLTKRHRRIRRDYAKDFTDWNARRWSKVLFSDEKKFSVKLQKPIYSWMPKGASRFKAEYLIPSIGRTDGIMVWVCIDGSGTLIIKRCPQNVDSLGYQKVLQSVLPFLKRYTQNLCDDKHFRCPLQERKVFSTRWGSCSPVRKY